MKTRSRQLYAYLLDAGVLHKTAEEIDSAKFLYRKLYKRQWKQQQTQRKEIRIGFTPQQFHLIRQKASASELTHTAYCRMAILFVIKEKQGIASPEKLLQALQLVSMAVIASINNTLTSPELTELLTHAEDILLQYIKKTNTV